MNCDGRPGLRLEAWILYMRQCCTVTALQHDLFNFISLAGICCAPSFIKSIRF